jgi:hypothetical protein
VETLAALGDEEAADGLGVAGHGGEAVDRVGGKRDDFTGVQKCDGGVEFVE